MHVILLLSTLVGLLTTDMPFRASAKPRILLAKHMIYKLFNFTVS